MERNRARWGVSGFDDYLAHTLEEGTSPNGVFGVKLVWGYVHELLFELRRLAREYEADDLAVLGDLFPEPRFVWLRREDVVAQAVSWAKAAQTEQWAAHQPPAREPRFDFEQIDALYTSPGSTTAAGVAGSPHNASGRTASRTRSSRPSRIRSRAACSTSSGSSRRRRSRLRSS